MSDFSFILPTKITDAILQSTDVPEAEYDAWVGGTGVFAALNQTSQIWRGMAAAPNGDVYASVSNGDIYKQTGGTGDFVALGQTSRLWFGMAASPNGDVYASVYNGDIYKQTGGTGDFVALGQTSRMWRAMAVAPNGDVYACVYNGDIYKQTGGIGDFVGLSQTTRDWYGMAVAPNGDVYACDYGGDIYKQTGGTGAFVALGQTSRLWVGMAASPNGDVYASVYNGDIYKQTGGTGDFVALGQTSRMWQAMAVAPNGDVYACCVYGGDIYKSAYVPVYSQEDQVIKNHVIYESLTNNNKNNDPETDTTNWLEVGPTNRWACYDGTIGNQSTQAESMLYILAPGAVDAIALLNLESSSVEIDVIDNNDNLVTNGTAWTGATGTTEPDDWDKVGTPADYATDDGMIKITTNAANEGCSQTIAVSAATEYQLLGKYKNTADDIAQIAILSFHSATGSVTRANMKLSAVDGAAFVDFSTANILTDYVPDRSKLTITDSAGKKLTGYIKAAGTGETYGSELVTNGDMETAAPNGDVYACVYNGDIYKQTGGVGNFEALGQTSRQWVGIAALPNGDVYACVYGGDIYKQSGGAGAFVALNQTTRSWRGMAVAPNGDVYACVSGGDIYKQTGGTGAFAALNQTTQNWRGMAVAPNGDVYACVVNGDIYKQTGGIGNFVGLSQETRDWRGMAAAPNGDVYASVYYGDIYKQAGGIGDFVELSQTTRNWRGMAAAPNGDVYACDYGGDIYKQTGGTGDFVALEQTPRIWVGMAASPNWWAAGEATLSQVSDERDGGSGSYAMEVTQTGTLSGVAAQYSGPMGMSLGALYSLSGYVKNLDATSAQLSMYGSVGGYFPLLATTGTSWAYVSGTFTMQEALSLYCRVVNASPGGKKGRFDDVSLTQVLTPSTTGVTITSTPDGSTFNWASKEAGFNYNDASGYSYEIEYTFIDSHPYEIEYTSDILATTDLASSTVESVFSHVFTTPAGCTSVRISLMGKASGDIVWFDDVILAPTEYSETVTTGASKTDLVKLDLPKHANALLTVKITNTGGTAKVGEIIVGEKTIIGLVEYAPGFGIKSWSTKSVDTYGKITIIKRGYSKWVKAPIRIAAADMDEVARILSIYKDTPIIWVVNQNYTSMIVYGFYSDFAVVWPHLDYFLCNIELEGLT